MSTDSSGGTQKPMGPPKGASGMQSELDSLLMELEGIDLDAPGPGSSPLDAFELELDAVEPETPRAAPPSPARWTPPSQSPRAAPAAPAVVPAVAGPSAEPPLDSRRLAGLEQELEAWKAKAYRAASELDSGRKRLAKEKADALQFANESLLRDLLPAIDSLKLATTHARPDGFDELLQGVTMTQQLLLQILARHGVESFDPTGAPFDPRFHQALSQIARTDVAAGTVVSVGQLGFKLQGRLVRPALVTVAGAPAPSAPTPQPVDAAPLEAVARKRWVPTQELEGRVDADGAPLRRAGADTAAGLRANTGPHGGPAALHANTAPHGAPAALRANTAPHGAPAALRANTAPHGAPAALRANTGSFGPPPSLRAHTGPHGAPVAPRPAVGQAPAEAAPASANTDNPFDNIDFSSLLEDTDT